MFGILDINTSSESNGSDSQIIAQFAAQTSIRSARVISRSDTLSLRRIVSSTISQRWEIETAIFDTNYFVDFFIHNVTNDVDTEIFIRPPLLVKKRRYSDISEESYLTSLQEEDMQDNSKFIWSRGTGITTSAATAGGDAIAFNGNPGSLIAKGDFIQFGNHDKLYLATEVPWANGTMTLFPRLMQDVPDNSFIRFGKNCAMKCYYDSDQASGLSYQDGVLVESPRIRLVEAL